MKKQFSILFVMALIMAILPMVSAIVPTSTTDYVCTNINYGCEYMFDGIYTDEGTQICGTNTACVDASTNYEVRGNYTFTYGLGDSTTFSIGMAENFEEDLSMNVSCLTSGGILQLAYASGGVTNLTGTIDNSCLLSGNKVALVISGYAGADGPPGRIYDPIFYGGGTPTTSVAIVYPLNTTYNTSITDLNYVLSDYTPISSYCYQEYANETPCGQSTAGSYTGMPEGTIDGNYNSGSGASGSSVNGATINYTIPTGVTSAIWQIMDVDGIPYAQPFNLTMTSSCIDDETTLQLKLEDMSSYLNYYCYNGTWALVGTSQYTEQDPSWFNEEAIIWNIISNPLTCSYSTNLGVTNNSLTCGNNVTGLIANTTGSYTWSVFGSVSGTSVSYQESADATFGVSGVWAVGTGSNIYDGDWGTYDACDDGTCYIYLNYTKPANYLSSIWEISDSSSIQNLTIPSTCSSQSTLQLRLRMINALATGYFECRNTTDWQTLDTGSVQINEEAVYWTTEDLTDFSDSVTFSLELPEPTPEPTPTPVPSNPNQGIIDNILILIPLGIAVIMGLLILMIYNGEMKLGDKGLVAIAGTIVVAAVVIGVGAMVLLKLGGMI